MPDTRPGITFKDGVCSACQSYENRKNVDYDLRFEELMVLCDRYRGMNGNDHDCMIAVSGGKDSHYQTFVMKEVMHMNPLLVTVEDNFPMTKAGQHNIKNISETFGCDIISMKPNIEAQKRVMRHTFEKYAKPTYFTDRYIYTYPLHMAKKFNTPLLVYGENIAYEYEDAEETSSAKGQIENGVASGLTDLPLKDGELTFFNPPDLKGLNPIYLSYFIEWNSYGNYEFSRRRGFHDLRGEWKRTHHIEDFDQVDSRAYMVHPWLKYPKFGHATATDYASRFIRYGMMSREEAVDLVNKHDHDLDAQCVRDFCEFLGYSEKEFWSIVDGFYNKDLFEKDSFGTWTLKKGL